MESPYWQRPLFSKHWRGAEVNIQLPSKKRREVERVGDCILGQNCFLCSPVARSVALGHCWDARVWEALWTWESPLYWAKVVTFSFRWASRQTQGLKWYVFPVTYLLISIIFPVTIKLEIFFYKGGIFFEGRTAAGWSKGGFKNWREQNQVEATHMFERWSSMVDVWKMTAAANTISLNLQDDQLQS